MAKQTWHMQGGPHPPQAPAPPVGYVSSTLVSDLETDIPDEDEGGRGRRGGRRGIRDRAAPPWHGAHPGLQHGQPGQLRHR
ncbi:hypothetical protein ANANG_G00240460 [Anguilla anguilla]|uniref:Uncharacterized protein n=1 Tax=Anguilla anguilla TaxID=7936 RepID=A0A9D3LV35_ANGAN|nr:hypothetical protein ANANG_G00240460 [Anguilla anguilla]